MDRGTGVEVLEFAGQTPAPPLSPPLAARLFYDTAEGCVRLSLNGGPYICLPIGAYAPPVDTITVASASRLADVDANLMLDGTIIFVRSVRDFFTLRRVSALTTDNITVIAAAGFVGGQWIREELEDLVWLAQPSWFLSSAGDDENDGATALTPIRTFSELERRWGSGTLTTDVVVTMLTNVIDDGESVLAAQQLSGSTLRFVGTATTVLSGTLTAATASNPATNVQQSVTDGTAPGWAAHVGRRIRLTANGAVAGIVKAVSASEARTTYFIIPDADGKNGTIYTPVGNEAYVVETLTTFANGLTIMSAEEGTVVIDSMSVGGTSGPRRREVYFVGSVLTGGVCIGGFGATYTGCLWSVACVFRSGTWRLIACGMVGSFGVNGGVIELPAATAGVAHFIVQGATASLVCGRFVGEDARGLGIFDSTGAGISFQAGMIVDSLGVLYGAGQASQGINMVRGSAIYYKDATTKPTLTGATGDVAVLGVTYAYTDVPFVTAWGGVVQMDGVCGTNPGERIQRGRATLVGGTIIVGAGGGGERIFISANSRIFLGPVTTVGGGMAIGEVSVTARTNGEPGVAAFTMTSTSLASALVATDVRPVDWMIVD